MTIEQLPRYQVLKAHLVDHITRGAWRPGDKLPSELDMTRQFSVSRMTANRAFNELEAEGFIVRVQGVGSFVATPRSEAATVDVHDIAAEIRGRGEAHACETLRAEQSFGKTINGLMGLAHDAAHSRVSLLHKADGLPIQIEDRFVNPAFAPDFEAMDFSRTTPSQALMAIASVQAAELVFDTRLPSSKQQKWLDITAHEPCLVLRRRSWSLNKVASITILTSPSSRYRYAGLSGTRPAGAERLPAL